MRLIPIILAACTLFISCSNSKPTVSADLNGFDLTQVPGSSFYLATRMQDGMKQQEGYILDGSRNGMWLDYGADGRVSMIQHFVNGKLNGPVFTFDNRGQINAQTDYYDGTYHGMKSTYKFGRPQEEIPYVMGKINGVMKKYYTNNKLMEEIEYKDNVQDGYYRHFNEEGTVDLEYLYKKGEKVSGGIVTPPE